MLSCFFGFRVQLNPSFYEIPFNISPGDVDNQAGIGIGDADVLEILLKEIDFRVILFDDLLKLLIGKLLNDILVVRLDIFNIASNSLLHFLYLDTFLINIAFYILLERNKVADDFPLLFVQLSPQLLERVVDIILLIMEVLLATESPASDDPICLF